MTNIDTRKLFVLLASGLVATAAHAQTFMRAYGSPTQQSKYAYAMDTTRDGGFIVAGNVAETFGTEDLWMAKLYPSGQIQWEQRLGTDTLDQVHAIRETADGGFFVAAEEGWFPGHLAPIQRDYWILRLDAAGNVLWQNLYGGPSDEYVEALVPTADGGALVAGSSASFAPAGVIDVWLLRLDAAGGIVWQKTLGGSQGEHVFAAEPLRDGGFLLGGQTSSFGAGELDMWVVRLDAGGNVVWQKAYGGTRSERVYAVTQAPAGTAGFVVAGITNSYTGIADDILILRLTEDGSVTWSRRFDGSTSALSQGDTLHGVIMPGPDEIVVAGSKPTSSGASDLWLIRLDGAGATVWQRALGGAGADQALALKIAPEDGGLVVAGSTGSYSPTGAPAAWLLRLDGNGVVSPGCLVAAETTSTGRPALLATTVTAATSSATSASISAPTTFVAAMGTTTTTQCIGKPAEVSHPWAEQALRFTDPSTLVWEDGFRSGADTFDLYRGDLSAVDANGATCFEPGLPGPTGQDTASPAAGAGWFYLVAGRNAAGEGGLGFASSGAARAAAIACP